MKIFGFNIWQCWFGAVILAAMVEYGLSNGNSVALYALFIYPAAAFFCRWKYGLKGWLRHMAAPRDVSNNAKAFAIIFGALVGGIPGGLMAWGLGSLVVTATLTTALMGAYLVSIWICGMTPRRKIEIITEPTGPAATITVN